MTQENAQPPKVITLETSEREGFLSENGNFSPTERSVFHVLCEHWEPIIPLNSITRTISSSGTGTSADLNKLIDKLQRARVALFTTAVEEGQRARTGIVLDDPDGPAYWSAVVDEHYTNMLESILAPLPLESRFREEFGGIPEKHVTRPSVKEIVAHITPEDAEPSIIAVPVTKKENVLILSHRLRNFTSLAIVKLRYYLSSANLLGELAKIQDTSLMAIKNGSAGNDPHFWLSLTKAVRENARTLQGAKISGVDKNFFYLSAIVYVLVGSQMEEAQERKKLEEEKKTDMEALASSVLQAPQYFVPRTQLEDQLDRLRNHYGDKFDAFKQEFHSNYLVEGAKRKLPVIVAIRERYIHRDNLYPAFMGEFPPLQEQIQQVLIQRMRDSLFSFIGGQDTSFISTDALNTTIKSEVEDRSLLVAELIEHPALLAEAMIHHLKKNKQVKTSDDLRQQLSNYFDAVTMRALPLHRWFSVDLKGLFTQAFRGLPLFKRIWIRITGKYDSYLETFTGRSSSSGESSSGGSSARRAATSSTASSKKQKKSSAGSKKSQVSKKATSSAGKSARRSPTATSSSGRSTGTATADGGKEKRAYNPKQVENAWEQFGSSIQKK